MTFIKPIKVAVPQSAVGDVNLKVSIPDTSSETPTVNVESSLNEPSFSIVDKLVESVQKVSIKEGQTVKVVIPTEPEVILEESVIEAPLIPKVDWCKNLDGDQADIPSGLYRDTNGYCWPKAKSSPVEEPVNDPPVITVVKQDYLATRGGVAQCNGRINEQTNYWYCFVKPSHELSNTHYTLTVTHPITGETRTASKITNGTGVYLEVQNVWPNISFNTRFTLDNERFSSIWGGDSFIKSE